MKTSLITILLPLIATALPTFDTGLTKRQLGDLFGLGGGGSVKCGPVAVLFSRGTFEPGSYGVTVGSAFTTALQAVLPAGTQFWGNDYDNNVVGYLTGGSTSGTSAMRAKAEAYVNACPNIKLVMGGYSQGAQVTHKALAGASEKVKSHVAAVVLFGDPMDGRAIPGIPKDRIQTVCAVGDTICTGLPIITASHMVYSANAATSAAWVRTKVSGLSTGSVTEAAAPKKAAKGKGSRRSIS